MIDTPTIRGIIDVTQDVLWGVGDVYYLFAIGTSAAALLLAILYYAAGVRRLKETAPVGLIMASALGFAAPLSLIANLYQPGRFYTLFFHTHLSSSPMSWGVIILTLYLLGTAAFDVLVYLSTKAGKDPVKSRLNRWVGAVAGFLALAVTTYTGIEIAAVRAIPMWHSTLTPILFLTGSAISGVSLVTVLGWLDNRIKKGEEKSFLGTFLLWFLLLEAFLEFIWLVVFVIFGGRSSVTIRQIIFHRSLSSFLLYGFLLTVVLPIVLLVLPSPRRSWTPLLTASVLATIGAWFLRWNIVIVGQKIPKASVNFGRYAPALTGHDSLLNVIGNIGLVIFLVIVLEWILESAARSKAGSTRNQSPHKQGKSVMDGGVTL